MHSRTGMIVGLLAGLVVMSACGGSSGGGEQTTTAFPSDLVVASPFTTSVASGSAAVKAPVVVEKTFAEKKAELDAILSGTTSAACAISIQPFNAAGLNPNCFGPSVEYQNHPGGGSGSLPGGDLGLWDENQDGQACAAAKVNSVIGSVDGAITTGVELLATMVCALNVYHPTTTLSPSSNIDLTADLATIIADNAITGLTVTSAVLERQANDSAGNPVYAYALAGTVNDGTNTYGMTLALKHIAVASTGTYSGKFSYSFSTETPTGGSGNCASDLTPAVNSVTDAGSILYSKASATQFTYRLQSAQFCGTDTTNIFDANMDIDPANKMSNANPDGWGNNYNYDVFTFNPANGVGNYAIAWQAGYGDAATRVFDASVALDAESNPQGCSYFGYGPESTVASGKGSITKFYCNWAGPGANGTTVEKAQRQCMSYSAATGLYVSTGATLQMDYAPTNTCDSVGAGFVYASGGLTGTMTNDNAAGAAVTNNLYLIADIADFTMPTVPADVYPTP